MQHRTAFHLWPFPAFLINKLFTLSDFNKAEDQFYNSCLPLLPASCNKIVDEKQSQHSRTPGILNLCALSHRDEIKVKRGNNLVASLSMMTKLERKDTGYDVAEVVGRRITKRYQKRERERRNFLC